MAARFTASFETVPPFDPGDYKSLTLRKVAVNVDAAEVDRALGRLRDRFARFDPAASSLAGERLFFDTRFSVTATVSCATCHQPERSFTDGLALARGVGEVPRKTMTVVGTAYDQWLFWDGRKDSLWAQALGPLESPVEHGGTRMQYVRLVAEHYGRAAEFGMEHAPFPLRRSHLVALEERFSTEFADTGRSRFRAAEDLAVASLFAPQTALATGDAVERRGFESLDRAIGISEREVGMDQGEREARLAVAEQPRRAQDGVQGAEPKQLRADKSGSPEDGDVDHRAPYAGSCIIMQEPA